MAVEASTPLTEEEAREIRHALETRASWYEARNKDVPEFTLRAIDKIDRALETLARVPR